MAIKHYYDILNGKKANFLKTKERGILRKKIKKAEKILESCIFCERKCKVNRKEVVGECKVPYQPYISSLFAHFGEEAELVPSGTIFFSGCNFHCVYCQNFDISQSIVGKKANVDEIVNWIEKSNIINVNFVGGEPTPNLHFILKVLEKLNINLPIIWNSNMYMSSESRELLDGVIDLYLADFKYGNDKCAERLSKVKNYFKIVSKNHKIVEKHCSLLIRHLVLPGHFDCCSKPIINWIIKNLKSDFVLNIMSQYKPLYLAKNYKEINREIFKEEYYKVVAYAKKIGIKNIEIQNL